MNSYLLMVHENEVAHAEAAPALTAKLLEQQQASAKRIRASGVYVDGERIRPSAEGKRVRRRNGKVEVTSGPFDGDGRALTGYCLVQAESLDAAVAIAKEIPTLPADDIEVRPTLMCAKMEPSKTDKPGKVFACAVLGAEPSEAAWVETMDRIAAHDTRFPPDSFLGGMRLDAPSKGRTIKGSNRAVMDGPFFESKEVIGGVAFARFTNIEEAVRWASESVYADLGTLEIRELWRS